ncbi:hypothetical protein Niako_2804 [Niastella koreensis GR20-10]|uniref:Uncharacterized protein n=1 Tax=Niastella koreensis (strain DSM 17620 / KACC 11465 / NBRC 106392 / GR20-10) TaxID=700598 RepID=G8T9E8_NIAKG|nr:hypothetical protein Niako_2804 [Niastella koreensis GR20-10]
MEIQELETIIFTWYRNSLRNDYHCTKYMLTFQNAPVRCSHRSGFLRRTASTALWKMFM